METSWESCADWYGETVGEKGHYFHQTLIFPALIKLLKNRPSQEKIRLLDLACGEGVVSRVLPSELRVEYVGVDASSALIALAKKKSRFGSFFTWDLTRPLSFPDSSSAKKSSKKFTHAIIILALQNIADPLAVLRNAASHLEKGGTLWIVLNHPCFRIPRQSSWEVDLDKKLQYRRVDTYLSSLKIPIATHPSKNTPPTYSFHFPLSSYVKMLKEAGFVVVDLEEWISDKQSTGGRAKMENRARNEFPLFLNLTALRM